MNRLSVLIVFMATLFFSGTIVAQTYDASMRRANRNYNAAKYKSAVKDYRKAIQLNAQMSEPYRNMARAYFWTENYSSAVAYYDFYLKVASSAKDIEQVRKERKLADERAGKSRYRRTKSQRKIFQSLQKGLKSGPAFSDKGGAFRMYETLLKTGFAEPALIEIQTQLSKKLLDEFDADIFPKEGEILPLISIESWKIQSQRLDATKKVSSDEAILGIVKRRTKIVLAIDAILSGKTEAAAALSAEALRENPDLKFLSWFVASSLLASGKIDLALKEISSLARSAKEDPLLLNYVRVIRALAIQQKGRHEDASEIFSTILKTH